MTDLWKGGAAEPTADPLAVPPADRCLLDASFTRPRTFPHRGIMTYTSTDGRKVASADELKGWLDDGKEIGFVKQDGKTDALAGRSRGVQHATDANRHLDARGAPGWVPIAYVGQDSGLTTGDFSHVAAFFEGIFSVRSGRPVGRYGGGHLFRFLDGVYGADVWALSWRAAATSWGIYPAAHLVQQAGAPWYPIAGVPTDDDLILRPFARWGARAPLSATSRAQLERTVANHATTSRLLG